MSITGLLGHNADYQYWANGNKLEVTNAVNSQYIGYTSVKMGNFTGHIYNVRAYSRDLTEDEIAINHSIDKERFNLP